MNIFIISAALALLLLIIQFIRQVRRTKKGNTEISRGSNLLQLAAVACFSGRHWRSDLYRRKYSPPGRQTRPTGQSDV